jgi:hypothetical protein
MIKCLAIIAPLYFALLTNMNEVARDYGNVRTLWCDRRLTLEHRREGRGAPGQGQEELGLSTVPWLDSSVWVETNSS